MRRERLVGVERRKSLKVISRIGVDKCEPEARPGVE
jgi:hypothetical protein